MSTETKVFTAEYFDHYADICERLEQRTHQHEYRQAARQARVLSALRSTLIEAQTTNLSAVVSGHYAEKLIAELDKLEAQHGLRGER